MLEDADWSMMHIQAAVLNSTEWDCKLAIISFFSDVEVLVGTRNHVVRGNFFLLRYTDNS